MEYRVFTNCQWVKTKLPQYTINSSTQVTCLPPGPEYADQVALLHAALVLSETVPNAGELGDIFVAIIEGVGECRLGPDYCSYWFPPKGES